MLINNAGAYLKKKFTEIAEDEFDFQFKVNCYGPFFCSQAVVSKMAERRDGTIIFVLGSETRSGPRGIRPTPARSWRSARSRNHSRMSSAI